MEVRDNDSLLVFKRVTFHVLQCFVEVRSFFLLFCGNSVFVTFFDIVDVLNYLFKWIFLINLKK